MLKITASIHCAKTLSEVEKLVQQQKKIVVHYTQSNS